MTDPRDPRSDDDVVDARLRVPPAPPEVVDAHIDAALVAFDELQAEADDRRGTVADLGDRRQRPAWYRRLPLGAIAAAVVLVALVGASLLVSSDDDDTETATTALDEGGAEAESAPAEDSMSSFDSAGGGSDMSGAIGATEAARPSFATLDDLRAHLEQRLAAEPPERSTDGETGTDTETDPLQPTDEPDGDGAPAPATTSQPCDPVAIARIDPAAVELTEAVVLDGRPVTAVVHQADDGRRLVVVDDQDCQVTADRSF